MLQHLQPSLLAQSDFGEIIPFLIFVVVVAVRIFKTLADRGGAGELPPEDETLESGESADPGTQLRRFLEEVRRQAAGEDAVPPPPPPLPRPMQPRPVSVRSSRPASSSSPPVAVYPHSVRPPAASAHVRPLPRPAVAAAAAAKKPLEPRPVATCARPPAQPSMLAALRRGRQGLREAVVLREVLGPPLGLRQTPTSDIVG